MHSSPGTTQSISGGTGESRAECPGPLREQSLGLCHDGNGHAHWVNIVNNCGFGTPSLHQAKNTRVLSGSVATNLTGPLVGGIVYLDQGFCGSATNPNCTSLEIDLETGRSSVRILPTRFSVPVSFVFSQGCFSSAQCLSQTCSRRLLECSARDASILVTFCPTAPSASLPTSTRLPISSTTSPISAARAVLPAFTPTSFQSSRLYTHLAARANSTGRLLGAELGGSIGGAAFLLLLFVAIICIRRRNARVAEARMPQRQVPFVVNPTWVLSSPTAPEGAGQSHLSLPDRARPRTVPVAHQMSMPNLAAQYRTRVMRPRASTVGTGSVLARTETWGSREREQLESEVGPTRSESSVWRPRIDILGARQQRAEPESFWAE